MELLVVCKSRKDVNFDGIQIVDSEVWNAGYEDFDRRIKDQIDGYFSRTYDAWCMASESYLNATGKEFCFYDKKEIHALVIGRKISAVCGDILAMGSLKGYKERSVPQFTISLPSGFNVYIRSVQEFKNMFTVSPITANEIKLVRKASPLGTKTSYGNAEAISVVLKNGEKVLAEKRRKEQQPYTANTMGTSTYLKVPTYINLDNTFIRSNGVVDEGTD